MSQEEKTVGSRSETPEEVHSALEAPQASGSTSASVANLHTLHVVQLEIAAEKARYNQAREEFEKARSNYEAVRVVWDKNPGNDLLTKRVAEAKDSMNSYKYSMDSSERFLARLENELARLQPAAKVSFEGKRKLLFCLLYCTLCLYVACREGFVYSRVASLTMGCIAHTVCEDVL